MKKYIYLFTLLYASISLLAQNKEDVNLIHADSTWGKEIIEVPFWFALDIDYKGFEDVRFAQGWENLNSNGFWTLAFAWDINLEVKPTKEFFEDNLKRYYNGLMKVVNEDESITIPKTKANLVETKSSNGTITFTGTVETYDAFTTKKMITLNVIIESNYCTKTKKHMPLFKFSPKEFTHKAWEMLDDVQLRDFGCEK